MRPVCTVYDAVSWEFTPCVMPRMREYLSACLASSGRSSEMRMPLTLVAMGGFKGPQESLPASGLGSKVSRCAAPPHIQIWMTDFAFALGAAAIKGEAARLPRSRPNALLRPQGRASRRVGGGENERGAR